MVLCSKICSITQKFPPFHIRIFISVKKKAIFAALLWQKFLTLYFTNSMWPFKNITKKRKLPQSLKPLRHEVLEKYLHKLTSGMSLD